MAATDKGVWDVQEVRDKQLASEWPIPSSVRDNQTFWTWGANDDGQLAQNNKTNQSSPVQIPGTNWVDVGGVKSD